MVTTAIERQIQDLMKSSGEKSYNEVLNRRKTQILLEKLISLDLSHLNLSILKKSITSFQSLRKLHLKYNNLTEIPSFIGNFIPIKNFEY